ncbi:MAG: sulfatase-like hydrolase/transferase [Bacteroidetes bacterium]|nr:sulfatase-like hydrolase/transferase [Bacteroidota bacterium]
MSIVFKAFLFLCVGLQLDTHDVVSEPNTTNSPNFIVILVDDQGWNGTSVQMSDKEPLSKSDYHLTPNLKKLANNGMRFSSAYASAPVCSPSRYAIQLGQTPARLRMIRVGMNTNHINHNTPFTIPKLLKKINPNYKTAHFGKWGIDVDPSVLGYDESDGITGNKDGGFDYKNHKKQWRNNISEDPKKIFSTTNSAIDFIERQADDNSPFFLQISHYAVHSDIMMREATLDKYQGLPKGKYQNHAGFAAMTEDLDTGVGLLLDKIKALGLENDTYIIYTSDNGAVPMMPPRMRYINGSNTPLSRGKWDAMEGGIRVPFIIAGPKIKAGIESRVPISFSDLLPSILDIAGNKLPQYDHLDGGSFKKVAFKNGKGKVKRNNDAIVFHVPYENGIALKRAHSAIIVDNFKLLKFYDNNQLMLFELNSDYGEKNDLSQVLIEKTKTLEATLEAYLTKVKAPKWQPGIHWKSKSLEKINSFH